MLTDDQKQKATAWFSELQTQLCAALELLEPHGATFEKTPWQRGTDEDDQGGGTMALLRGDTIEKAGVHVSTVYGSFSPEFRQQIEGASEDPRFWAAGISVIVHPRNPHAPTAHMNTRMVMTTKHWFGGGGDLTPLLASARRPDHEDTLAFHAAYKKACDQFDASYYPTFKEACDAYFHLPYRNETRGTGGIFYDHFNSGNWDTDFAFTQQVGRAFLDSYPPIIAKRMNTPYGDDERQAQMVQRGRYVEFNLLYDRGTMFGLKTGGNVESILSSMPPMVSWP